MAYIATSKIGDCSQCDATDVKVVKAGKLLYCIPRCNNKRKEAERAEKRKDNSKVRSLIAVGANLPNVTNIEMVQWFLDRREEMTGVCACGCGVPTSKGDDKRYKFSICHILPKKHFKSVKNHPLNWIELSFWPGCHTNMDSKGSYKWPTMKYWPLIVERFKILYPLIWPEEHQFVPEVLLKTLK